MSSAKVRDNIDLHYYDPHANSDKVYHCIIVETERGCEVEFAYGRRGSTLVYGKKTKEPVPSSRAYSIYQALVDQKVGKGYRRAPGVSGRVFRYTDESPVPISGSDDSTYSAETEVSDKIDSGVRPQLLNEITDAEAERLIEDPLWGMQQKMDGHRRMIRVAQHNAIGINRKGFVVPLSPEIESGARAIGKDLLIDGEHIGDTLHCFDILELEGSDLRQLPYKERHRILSGLIGRRKGRGLVLVALATAATEKKELYAGLKARKAEGAVFKLISAPYTPGRPASGGTALKNKFTETASVVVIGLNEKRSVRIGVFRAERLISIGNVTVPPNHPVPEEAAIVEVRYLYAYRNGGLNQPQYLGTRDDIELSACTEEQLKFVTEEDEPEAQAA